MAIPDMAWTCLHVLADNWVHAESFSAGHAIDWLLLAVQLDWPDTERTVSAICPAKVTNQGICFHGNCLKHENAKVEQCLLHKPCVLPDH